MHAHVFSQNTVYIELHSQVKYKSFCFLVSQESFRINAIGPILVAKHFSPLLLRPFRSSSSVDLSFPILINLSARVGSIGDNCLGGWYSYRASKAALNQFTRTLSRDIRWQKNACALTIHPGTFQNTSYAAYPSSAHVANVPLPGTVDTHLSLPYQKSVQKGNN